MKAVWTIALLTVKEAIRNRILYLLISFAAILILSSWIIGKLTVGDELKIVKDMGLSGIHFFGILITIIIGISLVFREMEKRTIYLILSKPIPRHRFLFGKFVGLALLLLGILLFLGTLFYSILALKGDRDPRPFLAFYGIYLEWLLIASVALMFSSFSTPLLSMMLTLAVFLMGHLSSSLLLLKARLHSASSNAILAILYYVLPDLEYFNIRAHVVHNLELPPHYFLYLTGYWFLYLATIMLFSAFLLEKKDFV